MMLHRTRRHGGRLPIERKIARAGVELGFLKLGAYHSKCQR